MILVLATLSFQQQYSQQLPGQASDAGFWVLGLLTALLLFTSVLLHELGHSMVALARG